MNPAAEPALLSLEGVRKTYGAVEALGACSLSIARGEFVTLLGPSGCGKTTILRAIAGLIRLDEGTIRLAGRLLSSASVHVPAEKRHMGMVFQSYAVWPHMSVRDNVALPLRLRGVSAAETRRRVEDVLAMCHLETFIDRAPHQLSGGQLQRVALARALVYRPDVVLLDEPLSNLDVALREELRHELYQLHKEIGGTFVLVTHDQVEAMSLSDRVVVMRAGKIEQVGSPHEIYSNPATPFVAEFVGSANVMKGTLVGVESGGTGIGHVDFGAWSLSVRVGAEAERGQPIICAIHPEAVLLSPASAQAPSNGFAARVRSVYFLGRTQEVVIEANGVTLRSIQMSDHRFAVGDSVFADIAYDAILLLPAGVPS